MLKKSFKVNSDIYGADNIQEMIENFSDFSLTYKDGILEISWETNEDIEEIFHEGMNHLVSLYNENM